MDPQISTVYREEPKATRLKEHAFLALASAARIWINPPPDFAISVHPSMITLKAFKAFSLTSNLELQKKLGF